MFLIEIESDAAADSLSQDDSYVLPTTIVFLSLFMIVLLSFLLLELCLFNLSLSSVVWHVFLSNRVGKYQDCFR